MVPRLATLTKFALRLLASHRDELAATLARSVAAGEPPRPAARFPALTLRQTRVLAGVLLAAMLSTSALYADRLHTCAGGAVTAHRAMGLAFAAAGLAFFRFGDVGQLRDLVAAEALRLPLPERRQLVAALQDRARADRATRRLGGLSVREWAVGAGMLVLLNAFAVGNYLLRLHSCAGGAADARRQVPIFAAMSVLACVLYVRTLRRIAREAPPDASVPDHA